MAIKKSPLPRLALLLALSIPVFAQDRVIGTGWYGSGALQGPSIDSRHTTMPPTGFIVTAGSNAAPATTKQAVFSVSKIAGEVGSVDGDRAFSFYYRKHAGTGSSVGLMAECRQDVTSSISCINSTMIIEAAGPGSSFAGWYNFQKFVSGNDGTGVEINANNQTGSDSASDYGTAGNRSQALILASAGNGKHTAAIVLDSQSGLTSSYFTGIDVRPSSIPGGGSSFRMANNTYLSSWDSGGVSVPMMYLDGGNATVIRNSGGYIYFVPSGASAIASITNLGFRVGDANAATRPLQAVGLIESIGGGYLLSGNTVVDSAQNLFGTSLSINGGLSTIDNAGVGAFQSVTSESLVQVRRSGVLKTQMTSGGGAAGGIVQTLDSTGSVTINTLDQNGANTSNLYLSSVLAINGSRDATLNSVIVDGGTFRLDRTGVNKVTISSGGGAAGGIVLTNDSTGFVVQNRMDNSGIRSNVAFNANGSNGLSATKTVRASGGAADCTLVYTFGILTGGTC